MSVQRSASTSNKNAQLYPASRSQDTLIYHRPHQEIIQASIFKYLLHSSTYVEASSSDACFQEMGRDCWFVSYIIVTVWCVWRSYDILHRKPDACPPCARSREGKIMLCDRNRIHGHAYEAQCHGRHRQRRESLPLFHK